MNFLIKVPVTRATKCREGFYVLVNGERLHFRRKKDALTAVADLLALQRLQVVTVREYAVRHHKRISQRIANAFGNSSTRGATGRAENPPAIPANRQ